MEKEEKKTTLSRREFLRNAGIMVGGATISSMAILSSCKGSETTVTETKTETATKTITAQGTTVTVTAATEAGEVAEAIVHLDINGNDTPVMVRPNWTLQQVLNDDLGLIGAKEWCDAGACGSCTVIMDGRPVLSCMMLAIECTGKKIETVEGIANSGHPIIEAYMNNHCLQCGYCTPGFICTAKALLDKKSNPTKDEIMSALSGNLCRCATYPMHVPAVQEAASKLGGS